MHLRIARPVSDLQRSAALYREGLGLSELGSFAGHDGFDGVMLGSHGGAWHVEFTVCHTHPVTPAPTPEDLLVFYVPDDREWTAACRRMLAAGFQEVAAFNPYWAQRGRTFQDHDGYRVVLEQADWRGGDDAAASGGAVTSR